MVPPLLITTFEISDFPRTVVVQNSQFEGRLRKLQLYTGAASAGNPLKQWQYSEVEFQFPCIPLLFLTFGI